MFKVMYGPETINEFEDWNDATEFADWEMEKGSPRLYVLDTESDQRFDQEDWQGDGIGWNDHLSY